MIAYYAPDMLTSDAVMLTKEPLGKEYLPIETEKLASMGFKKAFLDGVSLPLEEASEVNANPLYFQLYKNTKQQKWLQKMDAGKLYVPVMIQKNGAPRKLYKRVKDKLYVMAFLTKEDYDVFNADNRFEGYQPVYADRTEHYVVNGILL